MAENLDSDDVKQSGTLDLVTDIPDTARFGVTIAGVYWETTLDNLRTQLAGTVAAMQPPTVTLDGPTTGTVNIPITLTAEASAVAPATVVKVEFYNGNARIATATSLPYAVNYTPTAADEGLRVISAVVTDSNGLTSVSNLKKVTIANVVNVRNLAPKVTMTLNKTELSLGESIAITGVANDSDGTILRMEFFDASTLLYTATASPYTYVYTPQAPNALVLSVKATDNLGLATQTAAKVVPVSALIAPTVPGQPTNATAVAGDHVIGVNATPPTDDGGSGISGFNVYRSDGPNAIATNVSLLYSDTTAVNGTTYTYQVAAVNSAGEGPKSDPSNPATPSGGAPPTFNTTYNPGDNISTGTWNASTGTLLKLNLPLSTNTDPNPAVMVVFAPDGTTQVGQFDYNGADNGVACAIVYQGVTYYKTLTNGNVTLS